MTVRPDFSLTALSKRWVWAFLATGVLLGATPALAQDVQIVVGERVVDETGQEQIVWMQANQFLAQTTQLHFIEIKPTISSSNLCRRTETDQNILFGCVDPFFNTLILNCDITITLGDVLDDGGHVHSEPGFPRPLGAFNPMAGNSGSNGFLQTAYTSPEAGGIWEFTVTGVAPNGTPALPLTLTIFIREPGMLALPASSVYDLVGQTNSHPVNHFGTMQLNAALTRMANAFAAQFPAQRVAFNDMSLKYGGLFDFCAVTADSPTCVKKSIHAPWFPPHFHHRLGLAVDTRIPSGKAERWYYDRQINVIESFTYVKDEGDHWHIRLIDPCP